MGTYLVKRLLLTLFVVWASLTLMFILFFIMPGDPVELKGGEKALSESVKNNIREKYGLDDSVPVQYAKYWGRLATFDLGDSYRNDESVNKTLSQGIKTSGRLLLWGGLVQVFGGLTLGFIAAARQYSLVDKFTTVLSVALQAVPVFVSGLLAQFTFGVVPFKNNWGWLNFNVRWPENWYLGVIPNGNWKGIVLPAVVIAVVEMAYLARLLRSSMLDVLRADYLRTASAKGLPRRKILIKHALRNAIIPFITALGLTLVSIFGIAVQTESVFSLPGLGSKIAEAAIGQDAPVVLGLSTVVILFAALMTLLVDLSYGLIDPRIRITKGQK